MQIIYSTLIRELHNYAKENRYKKAVLGLSGGLDSAVSLCVAVRAFGPKNVTALLMPELGLTPHEDCEHAKLLAEHLGAEVHYQPINNFLVDYHFIPWEDAPVANENLKMRIRGTLLHHYAESQNALLVGSANRSDLALGYGGLDGEFTASFQILGDLYKSDVLRLGEFIGLPRELMDKASSMHLRRNQNDETDLNANWLKIDEILEQIQEGADPEVLIQKGMDALTVHKIARLLEQNLERKRVKGIIEVGRVTEAIRRAREAEASTLRNL